MSSVWLIRNDTFDDELETLGMVTIGWDMVGDLRAATDPAMVKDQIRAANPDQSAMSLALVAGTLERFARTMAIGDVVVAPRPDRIHLRIGTVTGDYLYVADAPTHRHRRPVAWTHTAIRRADLPDDATSGLRSISTLSQINHGAELFARLAADPRFSPQADNALPDLSTNTWLVGSRIDEADVTDRFIAAGIWQLKDGLDQRAAAIRIGDRIAIKSAYVRYSDLPFDNHRKPVSVMTIKARGVVSGTHDDHLSVDWDSTFTRRDWYFYTFQGAVWRLRDKDEYARALSRFVFDDENQDIEYFLSRSPWNKYSLPQDNSEDQKPTFRIPFPSTEPIYEAADRWREAVLTGTSLFSGRPLDYRAAVRDLTLYFIDSPDEGTDSFFQKLERQLTDAGDDAIALATELLYLYYLPVSTAAVSVSTKHAGVNGVAAWRDSVAPIPEELSTALSAGVARVGTAYQTQRWRLFAYLIRIVDVLTALPSDDRRSALTDWDRFQHTVSAVDDRGVWAIRYLLEHVLFPDHAMAGASRDDREQMLRAFAADDPTVSDANALRHHLEPNIRYGNRFAINLYQPPYRFEWRPLAEHKIIWAAWAMRAVSSPSTVTESLMSTLADASAVMAAPATALSPRLSSCSGTPANASSSPSLSAIHTRSPSYFRTPTTGDQGFSSIRSLPRSASIPPTPQSFLKKCPRSWPGRAMISPSVRPPPSKPRSV
ncbi:hypothetical protein GYA93_22335 [Gordonia desulfuricans]|uniref:Uncharacterized protein n=1 Tax=Gordonia desulfuricans TaxID=89051 RepID=A0A7K3LVF4_9ACTN|nr:hypothetical protein [Gordonia desulfuricans]NDK92275.1 hypothetical protein [Gordonia desulfuricans]